MEQMREEWTIGYRPQKEWGWLIALALFLGGLGAGLFLVSQFLGFLAGAVTGVLVTMLGALALFVDLGHPLRFWRAMRKPGTSWISRGAILITVFVAFGILYAAPSWAGLRWLPWAPDTALGQSIGVVAGIAAVGVVIYTGFLLASSPSIAFWNTVFVPAQFTLYSFLGGVDLILILRAIMGDVNVNARALETSQMWLGGISLVFIISYLAVMFSSNLASQNSVRLLTASSLAVLFLGGVIILGLVTPLLMIGYLYFIVGTVPPIVPALTGSLMLLGSLLFRYSLLRAGLYAPPLSEARTLRSRGVAV